MGPLTEAIGNDPAGNSVGVLLFSDEDGYLSEVEVYSLEGPFGGLPDVSQLELSRPTQIWPAPPPE
jgi:hypothetical protein